ncbi:LIM domain-containing protein HDR3-like [Rhododendron vialii]|uniref:LIM domain-containing protein HDR3-like n=1 Tax=Rhododendron vialii TaxID=182163 RepID=UPI00265F9DA8|nr:LIM domain-containing protein HDR3-like [Rhododendron vialii]
MEQFKPLVLHIHRFYEDHLKLNVEKNIPILLADVKELNRVSSEKKRNPFILGTTVTPAVAGAGVITTVKRLWRIGNSVKVDREQKRLTSNKVVAILLAFGLSKVKEMHGLSAVRNWVIKLNSLSVTYICWYKRLEYEVEEGMCELASYEWLKCWSPHDPSYTTEQTQFARTLHEFELLTIEQRSNEMGNGFRAAKHAVEKYGFQNTLNHIARTGKFPPQ